MKNKPYDKLSIEELKSYAEEKMYLHQFPNRSARRESLSKRNLVRQDVVIKDDKGNSRHNAGLP